MPPENRIQTTTVARSEAPDVTPFYLDKALWVLLLGPIFAFLNTKLGLGLNAAEVVAVVLPIVSYVVMHKWKTASLQKARIEAGAPVVVGPPPE